MGGAKKKLVTIALKMQNKPIRPWEAPSLWPVLGGQLLSLGNNSSPQPWYLILVEYVSNLQTFLE